MPYRASRRFDAIRALRHVKDPAFVRAMARTAADWDFARAAPVPVVPIESLVERQRDIRLRFGAGVFGETPLVDLVVLSLLVAQTRPSALFEFGTFTGLGTLHLALNAPHAIVHSLDLHPAERRSMSGLDWEAAIDQSTVGSIYGSDEEVASRVVQHLGDSREFDISGLVGTIEFIFIDAAHSYEYVRNDTEKAIELAAPGAMVVWHDYSRRCPDVQRVVREQVPKYSPVAVANTSMAIMRIP